MVIEIEGQKTVWCDVDETLAMSNLSDYSVEDRIVIPYVNGPVEVVPNRKNINLLQYFHKLGYVVVIWSKTGSDWARAVGEVLGLNPIVSLYITKPMYYIDDLDANEWIGTRRWRDNK